MKTSDIEKLVEQEFDPDYSIWKKMPDELGFSRQIYVFYMNEWARKYDDFGKSREKHLTHLNMISRYPSYIHENRELLFNSLKCLAVLDEDISALLSSGDIDTWRESNYLSIFSSEQIKIEPEKLRKWYEKGCPTTFEEMTDDLKKLKNFSELETRFEKNKKDTNFIEEVVDEIACDFALACAKKEEYFKRLDNFEKNNWIYLSDEEAKKLKDYIKKEKTKKWLRLKL